MTIAEKIQYSSDKTAFTLFKEGLFYKCYNEDAMLFVKQVREYKVSSKYIKNVGAEVFNIASTRLIKYFAHMPKVLFPGLADWYLASTSQNCPGYRTIVSYGFIVHGNNFIKIL